MVIEMAQNRQVTEKVVFMYMSFVCYEFRKYTKEYESDQGIKLTPWGVYFAS